MGFCQLLKKASLVGAFFVPGIWEQAAQAEVFCPAPASVARVEVQRVLMATRCASRTAAACA